LKDVREYYPFLLEVIQRTTTPGTPEENYLVEDGQTPPPSPTLTSNNNNNNHNHNNNKSVSHFVQYLLQENFCSD
jgi:hypothetical protein